uniref:SFRICE_005222 n=1 Tax=Spodoptera frugiperda TaxID=7108 RepID=A0A2H1WBA3_SPOFR
MCSAWAELRRVLRDVARNGDESHVRESHALARMGQLGRSGTIVMCFVISEPKIPYSALDVQPTYLTKTWEYHPITSPAWSEGIHRHKMKCVFHN